MYTGGKKQHRKLTWVQEKTGFSFICGSFSIIELGMIYFLREIFPLLIMCFKGVAASAIESLIFFYWITGL